MLKQSGIFQFSILKLVIILYVYCNFRVQVDQTGVQEATSKYEIRLAGQFDNHNSQVSWIR